jgi:L-rhamnose isomerase
VGYAVRDKKAFRLDTGHFHPREQIADKISPILLFVGRLPLHVSRGVRWDSDHTATLSDELQASVREIDSLNVSERVHVGLDFFDGSIEQNGSIGERRSWGGGGITSPR